MYKHLLIFTALIGAISLGAAAQSAILGEELTAVQAESDFNAVSVADDPFSSIAAPALDAAEVEALKGGDLWAFLNEIRNKITVFVTSNTPRGSGGRVDNLKEVYEIPAHNNVKETTDATFFPAKESVAKFPTPKDYTTKPTQFPAGTWNITTVSPRTNSYGPNMIGTDAIGRVEVFAKTDNKTSLGYYPDNGYAIHSNTKPMSESQSWGCIIIGQSDNSRLAASIASDRAQGSKNQTLTVQAPHKTNMPRW